MFCSIFRHSGGFVDVSILAAESLKAKCIFVKYIRMLYELINFNLTEFEYVLI